MAAQNFFCKAPTFGPAWPPLLLESAYLQEIFFSERKSLPGRGLRKPRAFFLQVDPLIWLGPFGFQPALPLLSVLKRAVARKMENRIASPCGKGTCEIGFHFSCNRTPPFRFPGTRQ
jgi:hypothetical protein